MILLNNEQATAFVRYMRKNCPNTNFWNNKRQKFRLLKWAGLSDAKARTISNYFNGQGIYCEPAFGTGPFLCNVRVYVDVAFNCKAVRKDPKKPMEGGEPDMRKVQIDALSAQIMELLLPDEAVNINKKKVAYKHAIW